jgi:hypothetical protein
VGVSTAGASTTGVVSSPERAFGEVGVSCAEAEGVFSELSGPGVVTGCAADPAGGVTGCADDPAAGGVAGCAGEPSTGGVAGAEVSAGVSTAGGVTEGEGVAGTEDVAGPGGFDGTFAGTEGESGLLASDTTP